MPCWLFGPMRRNQPVQDFPARGKGINGSDLVGSHEAAVALHVIAPNRRLSSGRLRGPSRIICDRVEPATSRTISGMAEYGADQEILTRTLPCRCAT